MQNEIIEGLMMTLLKFTLVSFDNAENVVESLFFSLTA